MKKILPFIVIILSFMLPPACVLAATEPVTVKIPVSCEAKGLSETFTYTMTTETPSEQLTVENSTLTLKNGESGNFSITFKAPDTYRFTVRQQAGSTTGASYDSTVYTVDVYVQEDDTGRMYSDIVAYTSGNTGKAAKLSFTNKPPETEQTGPSGKNRTPGPSSDSTSGGGRSGNVQTGDTTPIFSVICIFATALISIIILFAVLKKSRTSR